MGFGVMVGVFGVASVDSRGLWDRTEGVGWWCANVIVLR